MEWALNNFKSRLVSKDVQIQILASSLIVALEIPHCAIGRANLEDNARR
jgi:hypothetical protein